MLHHLIDKRSVDLKLLSVGKIFDQQLNQATSHNGTRALVIRDI